VSSIVQSLGSTRSFSAVEVFVPLLIEREGTMKDTILFDIDEIIPVGGGEIMAVLTLVDDEDDDIPPIVARRCPNCQCVIEDFVEHRCR